MYFFFLKYTDKTQVIFSNLFYEFENLVGIWKILNKGPGYSFV